MNTAADPVADVRARLRRAWRVCVPTGAGMSADVLLQGTAATVLPALFGPMG